MTTTPELDAVVLPPLPKTDYVIGMEGDGYSEDRLLSCPGYTDDQMQAYATAAILADRDRRAGDGERYRWLRDVGTLTWVPLTSAWRLPRAQCDAVIDRERWPGLRRAGARTQGDKA